MSIKLHVPWTFSTRKERHVCMRPFAFRWPRNVQHGYWRDSLVPTHLRMQQLARYKRRRKRCISAYRYIHMHIYAPVSEASLSRQLLKNFFFFTAGTTAPCLDNCLLSQAHPPTHWCRKLCSHALNHNETRQHRLNRCHPWMHFFGVCKKTLLAVIWMVRVMLEIDFNKVVTT